jgi:hypothetical protein
MDLFKDIQSALNALFGILRGLVSPTRGQPPLPAEPPGGLPVQVIKKVMMITYNPAIPSQGGQKLIEVMDWNDPQALLVAFIDDLRSCSYGYANYMVVESHVVDGIPVKADGFQYDPDQFYQHLKTGTGFHQPDAVDYHRIMGDFDIANKINTGAIDEIWLFAFPYTGFYESRMAGPGAFWCNAPELTGYDSCAKRFVLMAFNCERGVGEMHESYGHRAESIMKHTFRRTQGSDNLWERFNQVEKTHPGNAEVGSVHYAPNSTTDYDWGNTRQVVSGCNNWYRFPDLTGAPVLVDAREWGSGDIRLHHTWWMRHFPHIIGASEGLAYNWWMYITDPDTVV